MAVNDLIIFRKGTASQWTSANPVLASGEPGYDLTNSILKIGDGISNWAALSVHKHIIGDVTGLQTALDGKQASGSYASSSHSHTSSNITDFNSSVSGLLPVTNIVAGTNISVTSSAGAYTINSTGGSSSSVVAGSGIAVTSVGSTFTVHLDAYSILIGNGSATSYTVTHNLGATNDVHVSVRDVGTNYYVYPDVKYIDSNSCLIEFNSAPTTNQYRVSIIGF